MRTHAALEVHGLTGPADWPVCHDIELTVPHGEAHALVGPIHSGKTILLRHLLGLERADHGTVSIDGLSRDASVADESAIRLGRKRTGVVFQGSALLSRLSASENVELPLLEHTDCGREEARDAARSLLAEVGLELDGELMPDELGRAEQRRVALARALALRPAILLLDEPTVGLDGHAASEFDRIVYRLQEAYGFGALIFSHEVRYAFGAASTVYVMANGRIIERGSRDEVLASRHPVVQQLLHRRGGE